MLTYLINNFTLASLTWGPFLSSYILHFLGWKFAFDVDQKHSWQSIDASKHVINNVSSEKIPMRLIYNFHNEKEHDNQIIFKKKLFLVTSEKVTFLQIALTQRGRGSPSTGYQDSAKRKYNVTWTAEIFCEAYHTWANHI